MSESKFPAETDPIRQIAAEIYVQAFPLLLADAIRRAHPTGFHQFQIAPPDAESVAPGLAEDDDRAVVASAWIELSRGPIVLRIPPTGGRYISVTLFDTAGQPFMSVGSRTGADAGLDLAVVSPTWRGELPSGLRACRAPSQAVWAVSRIHAHAALDRAATMSIAKLQCLAVVPPETWPEEPVAVTGMAAPTPPLVRLVSQITPATLFHRLPGLLDRAPTSYQGAPRRQFEGLVAKLGPLPPLDGSSPQLERTLALGLADGMARIEAIPQAVLRVPAGDWANMYEPALGPTAAALTTAVRAYLSTGAPSREDLLLLVCDRDTTGQPLSGAHSYRIHFEPQAMPPTDAYWSLHARPAASEGNHRSLGSRSDLVLGPDGSLDLTIQPQSSIRRRASNSLSSPAGGFSLIMRVYSPWASALAGAWRMPVVERSDQHVEQTRPLIPRRNPPRRSPTIDCREAFGDAALTGSLCDEIRLERRDRGYHHLRLRRGRTRGAGRAHGHHIETDPSGGSAGPART